jgi:hypothetical protein
MYTAGINVGNYGRSAAENVTIAWNVSHSISGHASKEADAFFAVPDNYWHWQNMTSLPPGTSSVLPRFGTEAHWGPYPRDDFLSFARIYDGLAIYGRLKYVDTRNYLFHTDFCVFKWGNTTIYCDRHNYLK